MPWSPKQHRFFEAIAHNPAIAKRSGIPRATAATMASEGVKTRKEAVTGTASASAGAASGKAMKLRSPKITAPSGIINSKL